MSGLRGIQDVMAHIMKTRNMTVIGEETCQGCGNQIQHTKAINSISGKEEILPIGCICHQIAFEKKVNDDVMQREKQAQMRKLERFSFIPKEIENARLTNYDATTESQLAALKLCVDYCKAFPNNEKKNLVFSGLFGVGKSHLLYGMARYLAKEGYSTLFITTLDLVDAVMSTWNKNSELTEMEIVKRMIDVDFLVFDEIGYQPDGKRAIELAEKLVYKIANARTGKHTAYSTNLDHTELMDVLGPRSYDRIMSKRYAQMKQIDGPSGRQ